MARIYILEGQTNLSLGATYSGGALPTSGATNILGIDRGKHTFSSPAALAAVNLNRVEVNSGAASTIEDFEVDVTNGTSPAMLLKGAAGGFISYKGDATRVAVTGPMDYTCNGGTTGTLYVKGSRSKPVRITANADVQNIIVDGAHVIADEHASQEFDTVKILNGGKLTTARDVKVAKVGWGELEFRDAAKIDDGAGTGTLECTDKRAVVRVKALAALTMDSIDIPSGTLDCEGSGGDITFTNATIGEGAVIRNRHSGGEIIFTNTPTYYGSESIESIGGAL